MNFNYYLPVNLEFGCGKLNIVGEKTAQYGYRALIVTGKGSTKRTGVLDRVKQLLNKSGIEALVFDKVEPNPVTETVYEGVRVIKESKCDVIIALGGGSSIDCAKAMAFSAYNEGDIFDYIYGIKNGQKTMPLIAIPTTCGTGSEGNCFAVLTNSASGDKKSLRNMASIAKVSIIDPELMITMPEKVRAEVMFDALCHNIEAYISKSTQPMVEMQALYAIHLLGENMVKVYEGKADMEEWSKVTFASTLGGMCINMAGVALPHGMEHPASGLKNIIHGRGLAALSPIIYRETIEFAPAKFAEISRFIGGKNEKDFVQRFEELLTALNLQTTLKEEGIEEADVDWMTDNCLKVSAATINAHPRDFTKEEIRELYLKAM